MLKMGNMLNENTYENEHIEEVVMKERTMADDQNNYENEETNDWFDHNENTHTTTI